MCTEGCLAFGRRCLTDLHVKGKRVIEVGAWTESGSLRPFVEALGPAEYVGIDLKRGAGVDEICDANRLLQRFGPDSFDLLIAMEMVEHVRNWRNVIHNFKQVVRPGGMLLITTRSRGFRAHSYPNDHWRFEKEDFKKIFSDFIIVRLEDDPGAPGIFLFAQRPERWVENDLSGHALYSVVARAVVRDTTARDVFPHHLRAGPRWFLSLFSPPTLKRIIMKRLRRPRP